MQEEDVVTLSNGGRYLMLKELMPFENGPKYFLAVGVTDKDELDFNESVYFEYNEENDTIIKVPKTSPIYEDLAKLALAVTLIDDNEELQQEVEKYIEENESSI